MAIVDFVAAADLIGHRSRIAWTRVPNVGTDTLGPSPRIILKAKDLDYEFNDLPDAGVLFDSDDFPGAPTPDRVVDIATLPMEHADDLRVDVEVTTVRTLRDDMSVLPAQPDLTEDPDHWVETIRLTRRRVSNATGVAVAEHLELLDIGDAGAGLRSQIPRCYQLEVAESVDRPFRATVVPTHGYGLSRSLYDMVPTVWRKDDSAPLGIGPSSGRVGAIPESRVDAGPLRRFVDLFGVASDHLRSRAEGLATLHDVEHVKPDFLGQLAHLVGWNLSHGHSIPERRHQIRFASRLYALTGTVPGIMLWAKRLTRWDVQVHEYAENVFWTNDAGGEASTTRSGSFTVDTNDAELVASLRMANDQGDFTYDSRSTPDARYSPHTIGIFASFDPGDTAEDVARNTQRLFAGTDEFLPANLRMIVVLPEAPPTSTAVVALGVSASIDKVTNAP